MAAHWQRMMRKFALLLSLVLLLTPQLVAAHGYIVRSIPENRAVLERAPARLQYWFSEGLERDFSSITVTDQAGKIVASGGVHPDNPALLEARLPSDLPDGAYVAELRVAFASDGHVIIEPRLFFIGAAVAGVEGAGGFNAAVPLEIIWRGLLNLSLTLLLGMAALYALVLVPAWGNPTYRAGLLPPRLMNRLYIIAAAGLLVAFAANILALLQQTMILFNADLPRVLDQGLWQVVRAGTRFGEVWTARMFLLLLAAGLIGAAYYYREKQPSVVRPGWLAAVWALALAVGASAVASHAAGSLVLPWAALASHWLHSGAAALWAGGLAALTLILPAALAPYTGEARRAALLAALNRFSPLAVGMVGVMIATGIYNSSNWILTPDMAATPYGLTLAFKLVLALATLGMGTLHHVMLKPERLRRAEQLSARLIPLRALARWITPAALRGTFLPTLRLEIALAAAVLLAAGGLSATPLPVPGFIDRALPALTTARTQGDLSVTASISPGGPGVNSYDVRVEQAGAPLENGAVRVQVANAAQDWRGRWHSADALGEGLYVVTSAEMDAEGEWWLLVEVDGERFAYTVPITQDAAVIEALPPNAVHLLALLSVLVAAAYAVKTPALRFYRQLDLRPQTVTIALGATGITAGLLIFGYFSLQAVFEQTDAAVNPPPQIVNTALPDAESLRRGAALYDDLCAWDEESRDLAELTRRLDGLRDEEIFAITRDGWRSLLPCAALNDEQRWDVVNYLRTRQNS